MPTSFTAQLNEHVKLTKEQIDNVWKESVQDVIEDMQTLKTSGGRMPFLDGFLVNSLVSELNGSGFGAPDKASYIATIAGMEAGDNCRFGYTAEYALRQELGFVGEDSLGRSFNQQGNHFMGTAAAKFESFVEKNARRYGGS